MPSDVARPAGRQPDGVRGDGDVARAFESGDRALLIDARGRRYLVTLGAAKQFHSHAGVVEHDDLIGRPEGVTVTSTQGARLLAFRPTFGDYVLKMQRGAQVVYPKDLGLITMYADVFPGATVLEAGTGSGALTLALARAVGEHGRVISYEIRQDHHERGAANVEGWYRALGGKPENVDLRVGDVFDGVPENDVDRLVLDVPEPWRAVGPTSDALTPGGIFCAYLPTVPQVQQTAETLRSAAFGIVNVFEALLRTWNVERQSVRPDHRMVAHTGFIVTARKLTLE